MQPIKKVTGLYISVKQNGILDSQFSIEFNVYLWQVFVHVSTVFNNLDKGEIDEVIYPGTLDPHKLMDFVDCMDNELLASITKQYYNLH